MNLAKKFPKEDGWIRSLLTLRRVDEMSREQLEQLVTSGHPEKYEIGHLQQTGAKVLCYLREKPELKAARLQKDVEVFIAHIKSKAARPLQDVKVVRSSKSDTRYDVAVMSSSREIYCFNVYDMMIHTDWHDDDKAEEMEKLNIWLAGQPPPDLITPPVGDPDPAYRPMQPVYRDASGYLRFRDNAIVRLLLDDGKHDMNSLACMNFPIEDRVQFAQLTGYSLSGFGELSYVKDHHYYTAELLEGVPEGYPEDAARALAAEGQLQKFRKDLRVPLQKLFSSVFTVGNREVLDFVTEARDTLSSLFGCHPTDLGDRLQREEQ